MKPMTNEKYLIVPYNSTDEMIKFAEAYYVGYKSIRAEMIEPMVKKPMLNWRENLKKNGVKT